MMAHIALIDDDLTEAMVLEGMLMHGGAGHTLTHFQSLEAFSARPPGTPFDLVLLDRRLPPHAGFETSLPALATTGFDGPVVPISASEMVVEPVDGLNVTNPVQKSELLTPEAVTALITQVLGTDQ